MVKSWFTLCLRAGGFDRQLCVFFGLASLLLANRGLKLGLDLGSVFLLLAVFVILSGVLLFLGLRLFDRVLHFETTVLTLIQYYIQWSLIYVTVYQTLFSNLGRIRSLTKIVRAGHLLDPNLLVVMVLPSFISVWISVIAFKKHKHVLWKSSIFSWKKPSWVRTVFYFMLESKHEFLWWSLYKKCILISK